MKRILIFIGIIIVTFFLYNFNTFYMVENNMMDRILTDPRDTDFSIKVLAVDEESLNEIGQWPWPRDIIAETADKLASSGTRGVWVDVLYTEPSFNESEDEAWENVMEEHDNIYLSLYFQLLARQEAAGELQFDEIRRPAMSIPEDQTAHINVMEDRDRVVRQMMLGIPDETGDVIPAISVVLANQLLADDKKITWNQEGEWYRGNKEIPTGERNEINFSYASAPLDQRFDTIPIHKVINGDIPSSYFMNTIVLIGPYATALQDDFYTPMSSTLKMHGVEIHANIVQSLLDNQIHAPASKTVGFMIIFTLALVSFVLYEFVKAKGAVFILIGIVIGYPFAVIFIFNSQQILVPFIYPLLAVTLFYVASLVLQYIEERRERNKVTGIFGKYVSQSIVDEILASEEEVVVGGIRKDVTLVFVDIRGFTTLSEKIEAEEVINMLNKYLDLCTKAIFAYEGTVDKFMGDGVMAIFGAPVEQEDHPERAVKTALKMKLDSVELNKALEEQFGRSVHFGIGVHSGPAVIGNIGSYERLEYTAIGDTVNLAARLESNAKPGQILISKDTYERVKNDFEADELDAIKVKGKEKPVAIYEVKGIRTEVDD